MTAFGAARVIQCRAMTDQTDRKGRTVPRALTRKQAEEARAVVIEYFRLFCYDSAGQLRPEEELPRLFPPGHNGSGWDLAWEGNGPDEWTILVTSGGHNHVTGQPIAPATFPPGVLAEPINYCELGLYPA